MAGASVTYDALHSRGYNLERNTFQVDWALYHLELRWSLGSGVERLLDVGCGRGHLMEGAPRYAKRLVGVDVSAECIDDLKKRGHVAMLGNVESLRLHEQFDVVCALDVLEHVEPSAIAVSFENLRAHVAPLGEMLITIGDHSDVIDGVELHRTRKTFAQWRELFESYGQVVEAVDRATFNCGGARVFCFEVRP